MTEPCQCVYPDKCFCDKEDWPVHQPECFDAPIPGRQWYGGCTDDRPRVSPLGVCLECGGKACPVCGKENCPDGCEDEPDLDEWPQYRESYEFDHTPEEVAEDEE